jgi:methylthioribose-1-phosphate isomerase
MAFILQYENVAWYQHGIVRMLDRRTYPIKTEFVTCTSHQAVAQAIADMVTQSGGPYIAAAMGMALAAHEARNLGGAVLMEYLAKAAYTLSHARPTTVERMKSVVERQLEVAKAEVDKGAGFEDIVGALATAGMGRLEGNYRRSRLAGRYLVAQIPDGGTVMTQCYAESQIGGLLATCKEQGKSIRLICPETRPYFQGARLTASVAQDMGFDVTVITDNMPAYVMREQKVDAFISAADLITMDGHIVNKVGTFQIALAANYWGVPYYVTGTPNKAYPNATSVHIELRDPELVLEAMGTKVTLPGVKGYYPAFDVTPPKLCDGVVTDKGIFAPMNLWAYYEN